MSATNWALFAAAAGALTAMLLFLSRASARVIAGEGEAAHGVPPASSGEPEGAGSDPARRSPHRQPPLPTGSALLANVLLTHGALAGAVVGLAWYAAVPFATLGVRRPTPTAVATGVGIGLGLYAASETASMIADHLALEYDERLRELLAPATTAGWAGLLLVVLPTIAVAEELLFRGVLIGAVHAGYGVPLPVLVIGSSVLFGLGHSAQGLAGVAVTAALGLVLGVVFVVTGELAVVVVAHYVIDALEFTIRERILPWTGRRPS